MTVIVMVIYAAASPASPLRKKFRHSVEKAESVVKAQTRPIPKDFTKGPGR